MKFYIKQHSQQPDLKIQAHHKNVQLLENAEVTFSMWERDTSYYRILKRSAKIVKEEKLIEGRQSYDYFIVYEWRDRDVKDAGFFVGVFDIHFYDVDESGNKTFRYTLKIPVSEILEIEVL